MRIPRGWRPAGGATASPRKVQRKRARLSDPIVDPEGAFVKGVLEKVDREEITTESIGQHLVEAVEAQCDFDDGKAGASEHGSVSGGGRGGRNGGKLGEVSQPLYLVPIFELPKDVEPIHHPLFTFHPMKKPEIWPIEAD